MDGLKTTETVVKSRKRLRITCSAFLTALSWCMRPYAMPALVSYLLYVLDGLEHTLSEVARLVAVA